MRIHRMTASVLSRPDNQTIITNDSDLLAVSGIDQPFSHRYWFDGVPTCVMAFNERNWVIGSEPALGGPKMADLFRAHSRAGTSHKLRRRNFPFVLMAPRARGRAWMVRIGIPSEMTEGSPKTPSLDGRWPRGCRRKRKRVASFQCE